MMPGGPMNAAERAEAAREQGHCEALSMAVAMTAKGAPAYEVGFALAGVLAQFGCRPAEVFADVRGAYRFAAMTGRR